MIPQLILYICLLLKLTAKQFTGKTVILQIKFALSFRIKYD
jgi:hypothetical protein